MQNLAVSRHFISGVPTPLNIQNRNQDIRENLHLQNLEQLENLDFKSKLADLGHALEHDAQKVGQWAVNHKSDILKAGLFAYQHKDQIEAAWKAIHGLQNLNEL